MTTYTGRVTFVDNNKQWGFVLTPGNQKVQFHLNYGPEDNTQMPKVGDELIFTIKPSEKGLKTGEWAWVGQELVSSTPRWTGHVPVEPTFFKMNLAKFRLVDHMVTGSVDVLRRYRDGHTKTFEVVFGPMKLSSMVMSDALYLTIDGVRKGDYVSRAINIFKDGVKIGRVGDGVFFYENPQTFREALGWAIAMGCGKSTLLACNLDVIAGHMEVTESFEDFLYQLGRTFVYKSDGTRLFIERHVNQVALWIAKNHRVRSHRLAVA